MGINKMVKAYVKGMDVAVGEVVRFVNGAHAEKQANGRFKIVKGGKLDRAWAASNAKFGRTKGQRAQYNTMSPRAAKRAFNRYYNEKHVGTVFKSPRGLKQSRTYDLNHTGSRVVGDSRYRRNPKRFDYDGVDTGSKVRKPRSAAQKAHAEKMKALMASREWRDDHNMRGGDDRDERDNRRRQRGGAECLYNPKSKGC